MDRLVAPILVEMPKPENSVSKNEINLPTDSTSLKA
jgi:hypothetical protein